MIMSKRVKTIAPSVTLRAFRPVIVCFHSRDLGYGSEQGELVGYWTGVIDTWGKYTIQQFNGPTYYLFADEIVDISDDDSVCTTDADKLTRVMLILQEHEHNAQAAYDAIRALLFADLQPVTGPDPRD